MCNSELRGIEKSLARLSEVGIRPVAISVDAPDVSRNLAQNQGYTFPLLSDQNVEVIRRYDLVHAGAGENGHDIARPAEFLLDSTGTVRWINLTENYWIRARPEQVLEVSKVLK
ncbi:MAG TPA: redoxin domain-containing protein [Pyrinomonadaceae bacterium]|nr:redoxin domain-containing protein [Pyrinomonadaceae bacterium]